MSVKLERALRWAAACHQGQERRCSGTPYVQHVLAVALILDRLGFGDDVVIAGLLHDVVEDSGVNLDQVRERFGDVVAELVGFNSEVKVDIQGRKRPWLDRKTDHLKALDAAPVEALAVTLADKFHNLLSIQVDLDDGRPVWSTFHADRVNVLWYYRSMIERCGRGDPRLIELAEHCRTLLDVVEQTPSAGGSKTDEATDTPLIERSRRL